MTLFPARILVATDGSEEAQLAARAAIEVANETGSELHVVHAREPVGLSLSHRAPGLREEVYFPREAVEEFEKRARTLLEEQVGKMEEAGATVARAHLKTGSPVTEVVNLGEELGAGLVVVGSRGHSGIKRLVLGSTSEGVVRYAAGPVFVVRKEGLDAFPGKVLLATDGSAPSGRAAKAAAEISDKLDSELHVVHAGDAVPVPDFEAEVQAQFEEQARETLAGEVKRIEEAGGKVAQTHLRIGPAAEEIVNLAEELGVGAVVVGSRGLGAIKRVAIGSVSEGVVRHAHCSVLVVRAGEREA